MAVPDAPTLISPPSCDKASIITAVSSHRAGCSTWGRLSHRAAITSARLLMLLDSGSAMLAVTGWLGAVSWRRMAGQGLYVGSTGTGSMRSR